MPKQTMGKTGKTDIMKQGQTTDTAYGSDPDMRRKIKAGNVRDLKAK